MSMKKLLSSALLLSLTISMLSTPVSAKEVNEAIESKAYITSEAVELKELELKELKATIKEIGDYEWIVTDEEGKDYIVPILGFSELAEFKEAAFEAGQEVILRGHAPIKVAAMRIGMIGDQNEAKLFKVNNEQEGGQIESIAAKELKEKMLSNVYRLEDVIKERGNGEGPLVVEFKAPGVVGDENQLMTKDFIKPIEAVEAIRISKSISEEDFVLPVNTEEFSGKISFGITRAFAPGEEAIDSIPAFRTAALEGDLFIAQEIVVGELTLKLPNEVKGIATIKAIK